MDTATKISDQKRRNAHMPKVEHAGTLLEEEVLLLNSFTDRLLFMGLVIVFKFKSVMIIYKLY